MRASKLSHEGRDRYFLTISWMCRRKPKEGSNTSIASTLMDGIHRTSMMMRENESSYTALRGGMEDIDRDELDSALRTFMSDCGARIDELKQKMATEQAPSDSVDQSAHCKVGNPFPTGSHHPAVIHPQHQPPLDASNPYIFAAALPQVPQSPSPAATLPQPMTTPVAFRVWFLCFSSGWTAFRSISRCCIFSHLPDPLHEKLPISNCVVPIFSQIFKAFRIKQALGDRSRYASHSVVHELPQQDDADSDLGGPSPPPPPPSLQLPDVVLQG